MQSETGFPSSHQLKSYVVYKSRLKLAARAVLSADAGLLVLSLTVQALQGKMCQDSLLSEGGRSVRAKISGGNGKLCSRLFVLYCRNCPKEDKFRYFIPILRNKMCQNSLLSIRRG